MRLPVPPLPLRPAFFHVILCIGLVACAAFAIHLGLGVGQRQIDGIRVELAKLKADIGGKGREQLEAADAFRVAATDPSTWPGRDVVDALTQLMSEQAVVNRLALRTLSVSHVEPSSQAWGQVVVELAAHGSYADIKNWQGGLLARFHSLAVRSMRLQPVGHVGGAGGGVEAHMVWVMYVRD